MDGSSFDSIQKGVAELRAGLHENVEGLSPRQLTDTVRSLWQYHGNQPDEVCKFFESYGGLTVVYRTLREYDFMGVGEFEFAFVFEGVRVIHTIYV